MKSCSELNRIAIENTVKDIKTGNLYISNIDDNILIFLYLPGGYVEEDARSEVCNLK